MTSTTSRSPVTRRPPRWPGPPCDGREWCPAADGSAGVSARSSGSVPHMVKQGPVPAFVHSLIEYIAGAALIAAPLLLDYDSGAAKAVSIILGVLVLFLVATTTSTMSLINQVPLSMHIVFDY